MKQSKRRCARVLVEHKLLFAVALIVAAVTVTYGGLVVASLSCDRSDPRARPNSYHSVEGDERELARNRYVVTEVNVYDYFDFEPPGSDRTRLTQTVVLEMKSPFVKALVDIAAHLAGTRDDWEEQFREQNRNLAAFAQEAL